MAQPQQNLRKVDPVSTAEHNPGDPGDQSDHSQKHQHGQGSQVAAEAPAADGHARQVEARVPTGDVEQIDRAIWGDGDMARRDQTSETSPRVIDAKALGPRGSQT